MVHRPSLLLLLGGVLFVSLARGAAPPAPPSGEPDHSTRVFLARYCLDCHGAANPRGGLRLDTLAPTLDEASTREQWLVVLKQIESGEMPPRGKRRPSPREIRALGDAVRGAMSAALARRAAEGRVVLRRLNRTEYDNTVRDLLGVQVDLHALLPEDGSAHGFDNVGEALHLSSFLMERYLEAADRALGLAIANLPRPAQIRKRYSLQDTHQVRVTTERVFRKQDDGTVICFTSAPWQSVVLSPFYPPERGTYRFRIHASAVQSNGKVVSYRVDAGPMLMATRSELVGYFDAPAAAPAVTEFTMHLEARSTLRIHPYGLAASQAVHKVGAENWQGPGLAVHRVEVEGPLHDTWPPASHRRLFGDLPQKPAPVYHQRNRVEVVSESPEADARRILHAFARRAFRREVDAREVERFVALVRARLAEKQSFEQAVRVGLLAVLLSPEFLFLHEKPGRLDDFALASRLSYFLWSTMPDEELLTLARQNRLGDPETLRRQTERLLRSPKAAAFTRHFVDQWLGLRDIDFTVPSPLLYPEYDDLLKTSMLQEAYLFFSEVLTHDLPLTNFVTSDFTVLNERLARHYGIGGVTGHAFRKVAWPPDSQRGGVMTLAAVLKVTANGTTTSPVTRGAWVLDRLLGTPPAPPPAGVAAVEPDIRGATTIREQLARHRADASCARCHRQIDPPGFALENFDVIGGWRSHYRTLGRGKPVVIDGRRMPYLEGPQIDAAGEWSGRRFNNINDLKRLMLQDRERITRGLAVRLLTYATGGSPETLDERDLAALVRTADRDHGLRSLVHAVIQSRPFRYK